MYDGLSTMPAVIQSPQLRRVQKDRNHVIQAQLKEEGNFSLLYQRDGVHSYEYSMVTGTGSRKNMFYPHTRISQDRGQEVVQGPLPPAWLHVQQVL